MSKQIPEGFYDVVNEFIKDLLITFPEYEIIVKKFWELEDYEFSFMNITDEEQRKKAIEEDKKCKTEIVYVHCLNVFPERFFDILYKNEDIFKEENSNMNTEFLPRIVFRHLWNTENVSDITKESIWKYLQIILFSVISSVENKDSLGDTQKLFEAMDDELLKTKLEETINSVFKTMGEETENENSNEEKKMFNVEDIHSHLNDLMKGKIGKLAMEFAEEVSKDLNINTENIHTSKDVMNELFKNPSKIMNVFKKIGSKVEEKINSGEITQEEIMKEGLGLLEKMKGTKGMPDLNQMFKQMGMKMPAGMENQKIDINQMRARMEKNLKKEQMKERMKNNVSKKQEKKEEMKNTIEHAEQPLMNDEQLIKMFCEDKQKSKKSKKTKK